MKKTIPTFKTDKEAERFVDTADLSKYDLSGLKPMRLEFEKKSAQLNMRVPKAMLEAVKRRSVVRGIPYTRFIREAVESALSRPEKRNER
jgi:predicted DNA binding CopG/RHH family protein